MGSARPQAVLSTIVAVLLIVILVGFQVPKAKSATPPPAAPQPPATHADKTSPPPATHGDKAPPLAAHPEKAVGKGAPHGQAARADAVVQRGQQVFAQYCASCHGNEGKGDGISGQNLPIKPQNLTDGRQLNPLPDHFLFSVIAHGAQSVGLSPLMPAFKPYLADVQINELIKYIRTLAQPPFDPTAVLPVSAKREGPEQPIFFSHVIHSGSMQIPCQYCHANARRSSAAGLPSVERCMGCHKIIAAQGNPEVEKLLGYWERKESIPWIRVFKVPEFVQYPHKPHIEAGLQCQTCHGRIEAMERVYAKTGQNLVNDLMNLTGMSVPPTKLTMGWCVECHRSVNVSGVKSVQNVAALSVPSVHVAPGTDAQKRNAPLDCVVCHH